MREIPGYFHINRKTAKKKKKKRGRKGCFFVFTTIFSHLQQTRIQKDVGSVDYLIYPLVFWWAGNWPPKKFASQLYIHHFNAPGWPASGLTFSSLFLSLLPSLLYLLFFPERTATWAFLLEPDQFLEIWWTMNHFFCSKNLLIRLDIRILKRKLKLWFESRPFSFFLSFFFLFFSLFISISSLLLALI